MFSLENQGIEIIDTIIRVCDNKTTAGNWDLEFLMSHFQIDIVNRIMALPPPSDDDGPDYLGWGSPANGLGTFTSQKAYCSIANSGSSVEGNWDWIWKWKGPHRIQTFLWLAAHGRLLKIFEKT